MLYKILKGLAKELFFRSWQVILCALICYMLYEQGTKNDLKQIAQLQTQIEELKRQKREALLFQEKLRAQINSQSDPEWIELVLMKSLGVVPEFQTKVFFNPSSK